MPSTLDQQVVDLESLSFAQLSAMAKDFTAPEEVRVAAQNLREEMADAD
ncbi:hypothetical protein LP414_09415 [Polaromonas sp. P1(28)-13]|nr:hypothetical protein LP414_09415 [Polaromonas sp. P1(28)-13]